MNRTKPLSKAELNERALWIAADMLISEGVYFDSGEVTRRSGCAVSCGARRGRSF